MADKEYIERGALFDTLNEAGVPTDPTVNYFIMHAPTADVVEVRHGYWERIVDGGIGNCFGYCSICKAIHKADNPSELKYVYRHCRWCGAKMDGKGESRD